LEASDDTIMFTNTHFPHYYTMLHNTAMPLLPRYVVSVHLCDDEVVTYRLEAWNTLKIISQLSYLR